MSLAQRFTERAAAALVSLVAAGMTIGGVALAGLGAALRQTLDGAGGLSVVATGLMAAGAVLAVMGGVGTVWARTASDRGSRLAVGHGGRLALLLASLFLPLLLATRVAPLYDYWRDVGALADRYDVWTSANGPTALVFVPAAGVLLVPALEMIGAVAVALSCGLMVLLVLVRSAAALRLPAIGALLVGGCVAPVGAGWWPPSGWRRPSRR